MDVQDVQLDPESATLGDVSVVVVAAPDTQCGICKGVETAGIMCAT